MACDQYCSQPPGSDHITLALLFKICAECLEQSAKDDIKDGTKLKCKKTYLLYNIVMFFK